MLILTRNIGEVVMIGDDIAVTILSVLGSKTRIAVNAPENIVVLPAEVYDLMEGQGDEQGSGTRA